ncbi:MAG TPA: hypothetical protein VKT72_14800 [Candidatus Baltobacteraceae bacterium]|nr:hypothetical protein [Candidatus Baltobacteraceae bacterium]
MDDRRAAMKKARHDLGNLLTIAQASVEGMLDGVAPVTEARLKRLREVLAQAGELVDDAMSQSSE